MNTSLCKVVLPLLLLFSGYLQAGDLFISNARIHTITKSGTIENSDILIRDGKIVGVGDLEQPADIDVYDATGKEVTPGLMSPYTQIGAIEIDLVEQTVDASTEDVQFSAAYEISSALNPRSTLVPINRINGLTHGIVVPQSGHHIFSGQATAIRLGEPDKFILDNSVAMYALFGNSSSEYAGGSRAAAFLKMRQAFIDAAEYKQNKKAVDSGNWRELSLPLHDLAALAPVLSGKKPLVVIVNRASDISALLKLKAEFNLNLVIAGGSEAWLVGEELVAANVPVIIDPMMNIPRDFDQLAVRMDGAARLHESGVKVILTGANWLGAHNAWLVRQAAGNGVAYGLPYDVALRAMTLSPAEIFGLADRYGSIETGKDADLVIWNGDPLELLTRAEQVVMSGELIPMVSRSTRLRDRYRQLYDDHQQMLRK